MSEPSTTSLLRRSRALPIAAGASIVGLLLCAVTYAVAGETVHTRDIQLIDPLPDGVTVIADDLSCGSLPNGGEQCRRHVVLRRDGTPGDALAEELAERYRDRGFDLTSMVAGNGRTYFGSFGTCGPQLFVGVQWASFSGPPPLPDELDEDPALTTPPPTPTTVTTTAPTTGAVDPDTPVSNPDAAGVVAQADPTDPGPTEPAPTEPAPTEPAPGETVAVEPVAPTSVFEPTPAPTSAPSYPGVSPHGRGYDELADAVTVELAEPYPGMC